MLSGKMGKEGVSNKGAAQQNLEVGLRTPRLPRSQAVSEPHACLDRQDSNPEIERPLVAKS